MCRYELNPQLIKLDHFEHKVFFVSVTCDVECSADVAHTYMVDNMDI